MDEKPIKSKYKALHSAVHTSNLDFTRKTAVPDIPTTRWREWLFESRDIPAWSDEVGCSLSHIRSLTMTMDFELGSVRIFRGKHSSEKRITASVETLLTNDRGKLAEPQG